ncbi:acyl carrier protein [Candidatus Daviesbacteria bacterium]|nr:acyl carrier protein [Candidatus Daviesbacteria bacterium]
MTDTDVKVVQIIAEYLGLSPEDIDRHALLREELNLGPIELHDLLTELSQKFNVTFDDVDMEDLKKVDDLIVLIEDNLLD